MCTCIFKDWLIADDVLCWKHHTILQCHRTTCVYCITGRLLNGKGSCCFWSFVMFTWVRNLPWQQHVDGGVSFHWGCASGLNMWLPCRGSLHKSQTLWVQQCFQLLFTYCSREGWKGGGGGGGGEEWSDRSGGVCLCVESGLERGLWLRWKGFKLMWEYSLCFVFCFLLRLLSLTCSFSPVSFI